MFAVPEVDDDLNVSTPVETSQAISQNETIKVSTELLPTASISPVEQIENDSNKIDLSSTVTEQTTLPLKQHCSRRNLVHRNTIHICDQIDTRIASHQQHHSAPPSQNQQSKAGLQSINENVEYLPTFGINEQQQQHIINSRFPRSNTVPYPAYATLRRNGGNHPSSQYCYSDYTGLLQGTVSPAQTNLYSPTRQTLSLINTNFQPISPHHQQYNSRPVDILKPTFLLVPKDAEKQLVAQLSASHSPVAQDTRTTKSTTKPMTKKVDSKKVEKTISTKEQSTPTARTVEVQTNTNSPSKVTTAGATTTDDSHQHVSLIAAPNPSQYIQLVNVPYAVQSPIFLQDGPPETSIIQDEYFQVSDYHQQSTTIRSMPNISLTQVSPHHLYGSPTLPQHQPTQQIYEEQPQTQTQQQTTVKNSETAAVRSATAPPMTQKSKVLRIETGETDESSIASLDFQHADLVDVPGSWRYRSMPVASGPRRYRAPIPQSFYDPQHYASDSEQVVRSSSFRHPQQQQQLIAQSRSFSSIPTINRPFNSIRSYQQNPYSTSGRLNEKDVLKISSFYQSIGTLVYVARSVATLYTSDFDAMANLKDWKRLYVGVPIWLFNTGMNPKRNRCIRLVMSELGSSFILWDTIVNGASDVRLPKGRHITLKSLETGTILALKFDDASATDEFHQYFVKLSCDPRNSDLFDVFNAKRRYPKFILRKRKVKKSAISKPKDFNHINKVDEHDRDSLYTYSVLVDDGNVVG